MGWVSSVNGQVRNEEHGGIRLRSSVYIWATTSHGFSIKCCTYNSVAGAVTYSNYLVMLEGAGGQSSSMPLFVAGVVFGGAGRRLLLLRTMSWTLHRLRLSNMNVVVPSCFCIP